MSNIDENIKHSIDLYVSDHIKPGGFLRAVLENNLADSFGRADDINRNNLFDIVSYVYNKIPMGCWGSREKVNKWLLNEGDSDASQNV